MTQAIDSVSPIHMNLIVDYLSFTGKMTSYELSGAMVKSSSD